VVVASYTQTTLYCEQMLVSKELI